MTTKTATLHIDVWTDVACPYCYVGKQRLENAIAQSGHAEQIELELHTFELDPSAPKEPVEIASHTARLMGVSLERALEMDHRVKDMADQEGLPSEVERIHANSMDALRLLQLAKNHSVANELMSKLQGALFSGRQDTYDHAAMSSAAVELGIPAEEVRDVLAGNRFAEEVRRDSQGLGGEMRAPDNTPGPLEILSDAVEGYCDIETGSVFGQRRSASRMGVPYMREPTVP